jgi:hypothetical protein
MSFRMTAAALACGFAVVLGMTTGLAAQQAAALTRADAAPFLGDWLVNTKGDYGENRFAVSVKADGEKVMLEISSDTMPATTITDLAKRNASLVATYSITYEGNPVPVVLTLTPAGEGLDAAFDYAGGAYVEYGKGTKKTSARP